MSLNGKEFLFYYKPPLLLFNHFNTLLQKYQSGKPMKNILQNLCFLILTLLISSCDKESTDNEFGIGAGNGLSVSSTNLTLLPGSEGQSVISGGTEPYSVVENSNSNVVSVQLVARELQLTALAVGTASIKVKDSSSPTKTVIISVTVKTSLNANVPGSLSFSSDRSDFSVSGIAEYKIGLPTSGSGAIALQDFESIVILAYKVNTATSIDMTVIGFESNTSNYSGTYYYPASGKGVFVSVYLNSDPSDSLFLEKGYALKSSATANIQSVTSDVIQGTFSGNGYFVNNNVNVLAQTISVTNGTFNVPILHLGSIEGRSIDYNILSMGLKIFRQVKQK